MVENADHDGVDIARQHARGIGDRLAAAELHFLPGEHDDVAAELAHRDIERHARARRGLVEDHRQRLAGERLVGARAIAFDALLHGAALLDHPAQFGDRNFGQIEKVPRRRSAHPTAPCFLGFLRAGKLRAGALEHAHRVADFVLADDQRRHQPHDIVAGRDREQILVAQRLDQLPVRDHAAQAEQQAFAAHLGDDTRDSDP